MKNVRRKLKRFLAMLLITVTLVNTAVMSYSTAVNATSGVVTMGILDALYAMFGVSIGVGGQQAFFSQADLDYIITGARNGSVVQMGDYGEVDFSDSANVQRWLDTCAAVDGFLIGATTNNFAFGEDAAKQIRSNMLAIDMAAYKNTGTCASTALYDYITNFRVDTGDGLLDLQDACGLFSGDNENDNNNNIDWTKYAAISALLSAALISKATDLKDYFSSLVKPDASDFSAYDAAFEDICFDGTYQTNDAGEYVYNIVGNDQSFQYVFDGATSIYKIVGVISSSGDQIIFNYLNGSSLSIISLYASKQISLDNGRVWGGKSYHHVGTGNFSGNIPIYSSGEAALEALQNDDFSGAENLNDSNFPPQIRA